mgnify:CR=1 FL=1
MAAKYAAEEAPGLVIASVQLVAWPVMAHPWTCAPLNRCAARTRSIVMKLAIPTVPGSNRHVSAGQKNGVPSV